MVAARREFVPQEIVDEVALKTESEKKEFLAWLETKKGNPYMFDANTYYNAFAIYKRVNFEDNDFFEVICGKEGMGKSKFARKKAWLVDPTFNASRIVYDREQLFEWCENNFNADEGNKRSKGKAILLDEGNMFLFSREAMSMDNVDVVKLFTLIRQLNLYIIICIPQYKSVDSYIKGHRVDRLTHIKQAASNWRLFSSYNKSGVEIINETLKKGIPLDKINVPRQYLYKGGTNDMLPTGMDDKDYIHTKAGAFMDYVKSKRTEAMKNKEPKFIPVKEAQKIIPLGRDAIVNGIRKGTIVGKKVGSLYYVDREKFADVAQNGGVGGSSILTNSLGRGYNSVFTRLDKDLGGSKDELEH